MAKSSSTGPRASPTSGHVARKRFGQNFLVDRHYIDRIVAAIDPQLEDNLVEIGPGLGALTVPLLDRLEHLTVIEIDRDLAAKLVAQYPPARLALHNADALEFDFSSVGTDLRVDGNLPYCRFAFASNDSSSFRPERSGPRRRSTRRSCS